MYPDWWQGRRFKQPITAWAGGVSNETTRDIVQAELLGSPDDPEAFGSGAVPEKYIINHITNIIAQANHNQDNIIAISFISLSISNLT